MELGSKIKRLRLERGFTQKELAEKLGARYHYISRWESGVKPSAKYIAKLAEALGVNLSELDMSAGFNVLEEQKTDVKVKKEEQQELTHTITSCIENALSQDPRLRLIDARMEEILKRLKSLEQELKQIMRSLE